MTIETLAKQIFEECEKEGEPVTVEESLEMARMELGAKDIKTYVQSTVEKPKSDKKPKTVKVSDEKASLFSTIFTNLSENYGESATIEKENKLIIVKLGGKTFKIDLIEQRPPKNSK